MQTKTIYKIHIKIIITLRKIKNVQILTTNFVDQETKDIIITLKNNQNIERGHIINKENINKKINSFKTIRFRIKEDLGEKIQ